jgi:hypothetical protein
VSCLGDPEGERGSLVKGNLPGFDGILHVSQVVDYFSH